jgi:hypothetical protein
MGDKCPECEKVGCMTTYYGDPDQEEQENEIAEKWLERWAHAVADPE